MRITVHHTRYYEWEPVPEDVILTEQDVLAGKVRPAARQIPNKPRLWSGNWDMRVTREADTYSEFHVDEASIFHAMFHRDVRSLRLSRKQAVALLLSKYAIPERFPEATATDVTVHDDGPHEDTIRNLLAPHLASGLVNQAQHDEHVSKLLEHHPHHGKAHEKHLRAHFGLPAKEDT